MAHLPSPAYYVYEHFSTYHDREGPTVGRLALERSCLFKHGSRSAGRRSRAPVDRAGKGS
jgi:hypothetical protein